MKESVFRVNFRILLKRYPLEADYIKYLLKRATSVIQKSMSFALVRDGEKIFEVQGYREFPLEEVVALWRPGDAFHLEHDWPEVAFLLQQPSPDFPRVAEEWKKAWKGNKRAFYAKKYREGREESINEKKRARVICSLCGKNVTRGSFYNHRNQMHPDEKAEAKPF